MFSDREKDKDYFIENLSVLINSNINISEALDIIYSGVKNNNFKKKVSFIKDQIDSGFYFWKSLEKTKMFPLKDISLGSRLAG
ncbi:MAG: type II secretion system F family protein [Patescibacteria group bacterium]